VCFFDFHDRETIGLLNGAPAPSALRLVPRQNYPPAVCVVDLVLLGPRHLDDCVAVDSAALAPPCAKRVHSGLSHAICRTSKTTTDSHRRPPPRGSGRSKTPSRLQNLLRVAVPTNEPGATLQVHGTFLDAGPSDLQWVAL